MPLPPELQARLSKRGLVKQKKKGESEGSGKGADGESSSSVSRAPVDYTETLVLPPNWKKINDEKTSHPYFWNTKTGEVSWHLPPGTRTVSQKKPQPKPPEPKPPQSKPPPKVQMPTVTASRSEAVERNFIQKSARPVPYRIPSQKPKRKKPSDDLDPMDPAAYSDCARGTWASGMEQGIEAKTGVDSTASGPLFQMRPYPNPGAILKINQEKTAS